MFRTGTTSFAWGMEGACDTCCNSAVTKMHVQILSDRLVPCANCFMCKIASCANYIKIVNLINHLLFCYSRAVLSEVSSCIAAARESASFRGKW